MVSTTHDLALGTDAQQALFTDARSPMRFSAAPVPVDTVRAVYDLVKWGPTGNNAMPLRLAVVQSDESRAVVVASASPVNQAKLDTAPLILIAAADTDYHELSHITAPGVEGLRDRLHIDADSRRAKAHDNTWLQVGYLIVGLRAAGLAVRPMGGFDKRSVTEALFVGTGWNAELILAVGYPVADGEDGSGERKPRPEWEDIARVI
jgi:3-hydroxypropanoate dehydrogenase